MTTTITTTNSSPPLKKLKLQENIEYEPLTLLGTEHFEKKSLFGLLKSIRQNYNAKWDLLPFTQKYYLLSKQCFVRNFCRAGGCFCEAIKYIGKVRKKKNGEELKDIVDVNILYEFDKVLTILDLFFFFIL